MLDFLFLIWDQLILQPMANSLVLLYTILFNNFGLSILLFTVVIRLITLPLTLKQIRMTKGMSQLQPQLKQIQLQYKDDKPKVSQETMRLYKEHGVNPLGCLGPMFIQMPIWIGLYQAIIQTLPSEPERLIGLSQKLYSWLPWVNEAVPLSSSFLWLDLAVGPGEQSDFLLPALVGLSMWAVQKMSTVPSVDARQAQTNQMMLWMMPIMFGAFTWQFPAGLAVYILFSNIVGVVIQYYVGGKQPIELFGRSFLGTETSRAERAAQVAAEANAPKGQTSSPKESDDDDKSTEVLRKDGRRSNRNRSRRTGRRTRRRRH